VDVEAISRSLLNEQRITQLQEKLAEQAVTIDILSISCVVIVFIIISIITAMTLKS